MNRLSAIETPKIDRVVRDEDEVALHDPCDQVMVLGRSEAEKVDVVGFIALSAGDLGERGMQTLVDQKPQPS